MANPRHDPQGLDSGAEPVSTAAGIAVDALQQAASEQGTSPDAGSESPRPPEAARAPDAGSDSPRPPDAEPGSLALADLKSKWEAEWKAKMQVLIRFPLEQYDEEDEAFVYFAASNAEFVAELTRHIIKLMSPRLIVKQLCVPAGASIASLLSRLDEFCRFSASKMVKDDFWKNNKLPAPADPDQFLPIGCGPWMSVHEGPLIM